jgi:Protein of unknown function (DUF3592)
LVIVCCALLAASSAIDVAQTVRSARWPSVTGAIIASNSRVDLVAVAPGGTGRGYRLRRLYLKYRYDVDGRKYESSQANMLSAYVSTPTRQELENYATGHSVVVHYDPKEPAMAVIDTSLPWGRCIQLALTTLVLVLTWRGTEATLTRDISGNNNNEEESRIET